MGFDQVLEVGVVVLGTPTVALLLWCWGFDKVWNRVVKLVRSRNPKPTGWDGKPDPDEDPYAEVRRYKRRMRLKAERAWVLEWRFSLGAEEVVELEALYAEHLRETGVGYSIPYEMEKRYKIDFVMGEVRDRVRHTAAGNPELIRRPKTREQREMEAAVAAANAKAVAVRMDFDWPGAVTGAVMRTGSGMEISAHGITTKSANGVILPAGRSGPTVVPRKASDGMVETYVDGRYRYTYGALSGAERSTMVTDVMGTDLVARMSPAEFSRKVTEEVAWQERFR